MIIANGSDDQVTIGPWERELARASVRRHAQDGEDLKMLMEMLSLEDDLVDA
jgi:hypothetical protein